MHKYVSNSGTGSNYTIHLGAKTVENVQSRKSDEYDQG